MDKKDLNKTENSIEDNLDTVNTIIHNLKDSIKEKKIASMILLLGTIIVLIMTILVGINAYSRYIVGKGIMDSMLAFGIAFGMTILTGNMTLLCRKSMKYDKKVLDFAYENKNNLEHKLIKSRGDSWDFTYERTPEIMDAVDYVDVAREEDKKLVLTKKNNRGGLKK